MHIKISYVIDVNISNLYFSEGQTNIVELNEEINERTIEILLEYFYIGSIPDVTVE